MARQGRDENGLTPRENILCEEFLIDLNQTQAAIRAGYSPRTARTQAAALFAKPNIRAYVERKMAERSRRTGVNADRVLRELARIAFVQAPDVINMDEASLKGDAEPDDVATIQSVKVKRVSGEDFDSVEREIKLADKVKSLELLMRHLGMIDGARGTGGGPKSGTEQTETGVVVLPEVEAIPAEEGGDSGAE